MAQGTPPKPQRVSDLKQKIMNPSMTSHYMVEIGPPKAPRNKGSDSPDFIQLMQELGAEYSPINNTDLLSIPCTAASLPGSFLMTNEILDDRTGVTEKHAYRRSYDDTIDFTFYVDSPKYYVIKYFESWLAFITNQKTNTFTNSEYNYRIRFPKKYFASKLLIQKFEKNFGSATSEQYSPMQYEFINAFPLNITSMPVSYDSSELLKCTVAFAFSRYILTKSSYTSSGVTKKVPSNAPAVPELQRIDDGRKVGTDPSNYLQDDIRSIENDPGGYKFDTSKITAGTINDRSTDPDIARALQQERELIERQERSRAQRLLSGDVVDGASFELI
jgi:hypothetical protein